MELSADGPSQRRPRTGPALSRPPSPFSPFPGQDRSSRGGKKVRQYFLHILLPNFFCFACPGVRFRCVFAAKLKNVFFVCFFRIGGGERTAMDLSADGPSQSPPRTGPASQTLPRTDEAISQTLPRIGPASQTPPRTDEASSVQTSLPLLSLPWPGSKQQRRKKS